MPKTPTPPLTATVPMKDSVRCLSCGAEDFTESKRLLGNMQAVQTGVSVLTCVVCGSTYRLTYGHAGATLQQLLGPTIDRMITALAGMKKRV